MRIPRKLQSETLEKSLKFFRGVILDDDFPSLTGRREPDPRP